MKKFLLLGFMLTLAFTFSESWAQERTVSGKVTSIDDGTALPGVNVVLKGTTTGTVTDIDGNFTLTLPTGEGTLVFSFIGLATEEISVGSRSVIDVQMSQDVQQLSEVVVTAAGIEREERALGYAVSTVDSEEVLKAREANIANSLSGKVAGVDVTASSGTVGASSRVVIRGAASIGGNNQPLYVVDGVPISNSNIASVDRFSGVDYGNRAGDINPDDIESLTVLKGAAAAALYGQRAANGVIIITTKKGKKNEKMSVTVNSSIRFDNPFRLPDYQNTYGQGSINKLDSAGTVSWGPRMDGRSFIAPDGTTKRYEAFPDNVEDFYETGKTIINSVSLAGGDEKSTYRFGVTAFDQEGIVPNTELSKLSFNMNGSREFSNKFYSSFGINYIRSRNDGRPETGFNNPNAVASIVTDIPRNIDVEGLRDYMNEDGTPKLFLGLTQNPYFSLNENVFTQNVDRMFGFGQVGVKPLDWINISWKLGADIIRDKRKQIYVPNSVGAANGQFWTDRIFESQINSDLIVTINRNLTDGLNANLILGHNVNEIYVESSFNRGQDLVDPQLFIPDNATVNTPSETVLDRRRLYGVFFDLGFSYNDYLFLNITGRNDWNSTLPKDNQSYFYPGVSASAVLTDAFDLKSNILSYAKLRAGWAQVGGYSDPFTLQFTFIPQTDIFQLFGVDNSYPFNGIPGFAGTNQIPNSELEPEITSTFEVGTELQFFNSRLILDATYYHSTTDNQIIGVSVAPSTGFSTQLLNAGSIVNKGIELRLEGTALQIGDFKWVATVNFAKNENELVELLDGFDNTDVPGTRTNPSLKAFVGEPLGTIFGSGWRRDQNGNYLINPDNGLRLDEEGVKLGNITPDFRLGFQNEFRFKGLSVSALIDWKQGGELHSQTIQNVRASGVVTETEAGRDIAYIDNGVILLEEDEEGNAVSTKPNDIAITAQQFWQQQDDVDEDGIFDATYVKLREVRVGYSLPKSLIENTPFGRIEVGFEARNLALLYSKIPHIDPEVSFYGPGNAQGIEAFNLPTTRSYGFNVRLTF
ncbi:SusC/RagA family TonB-linked outer membrane protein [Fulvivirga kasyanovii]|uniref:SusC/RagA family TonB-linked outer membrane protein n=1 Tax=Fulvivirga kasyanovii TaxID=396812 RepID=A0ABW9RRP2_9BACT|nr:SusC/RagA family TonB-linked outer membrane protein [Fulvivirga kasyanovii]MTI26397.1 SusC/RagA family TonB-linked outer membrane protein [Fulvivirga kasyanovii]